ncbi:MAG TPA: hypothetical protein VGV59_06155 [Pyrinomonadaceae bacterium]|nr:hypothetical protein [Pyrinomonadaceae bacterium]
MDWDTALREENGRINPLGLYDLARKMRPVGEAYQRLIADWREVLPTQSVCLRVPVVIPSEHDAAWARRRRVQARAARGAAPTAPANPDTDGRQT